ncbi:glycosyltransferase family 2 protein [Gloeothece verrucosa]|uniref:Glycosyl transferase family 2 n=1 Tax=Gloeothece verrucosa (strain PCC 7822) TaxID=497965 RepID=E0U5S4_GLOV7|nr:glycosyltransferase family 2 protein [Gloeothece verrucosa]ADN15915.1 glycosyl transferase family 2 [Gloeothece verrucosa PCC 7822]
MKLFIEVITYTLAIVLLIPSLVLFVECTIAILLPAPLIDKIETTPAAKIGVLVPAHNEALVIATTLASLINQVSSPESIVVIADNCTDETAAIAAQFGVKVIERIEPEQRGKGYALDFGLRYLALNPPDVVVIIDADCQVTEGSIEQLVSMALKEQKPIQATYVMEKPAVSQPKDIVSALAFIVKNQVRTTGLAGMGLPCLLAGTGMAFPWFVINKVQWASGNLVEDMQLGIDLALAGYAPRFCRSAKVIGILPQQQKAATTQRTRWEHGHVQTLLTQVPQLGMAALAQRRFELLALALEIGVPPLSLLVMLWGLGLIIAIGAGLFLGIWLPLGILSLAGLMIFTAILGGWFKFASKELPGTALLGIPGYLLWKIPLYVALLLKPEKKWVKTERESLNS